jgi:NitT/TauT family transport system substrate-binding protein
MIVLLKRPAALLAGVALTVAGCSASPAATTPASIGPSGSAASSASASVGPPESKTLKIGVDGLPDFGNVGVFRWVAELKSKYGIDAQVIDLGSTAGPFRAMVTGNVDMLLGQIPSGVQLNIQSGSNDVKMIAAEDQRSDYVLLSTNDIATLADLIGKKVGISEPGGGAESLTKAALKIAKVDISKIDFVQVGGTDARIAALISGNVSAGAAHIPDALAAIEKGGVKQLSPIGAAIGPYEFHTLWSTQAWLSRNPNLAQIAVNLFVDANRWEADDKAAYIALSVTNVTGLSDAIRSTTYDTFKQISYFAVNGGMDAASINSTVAVEQGVGNLPAVMPDLSTWTDPSYVQKYLAANGTR